MCILGKGVFGAARHGVSRMYTMASALPVHNLCIDDLCRIYMQDAYRWCVVQMIQHSLQPLPCTL